MQLLTHFVIFCS